MKNLSTSRPVLLVLATAVLLAGCASSNAFKNRYASSDFEMSYMESGKNDADRLMSRINAELAAVDKAFTSVASLTKDLPGPAGTQVKGAVSSIKAVMDETVKGKVLAAMKGEQAELSAYLGRHNLFTAKDHPYGYNLIEALEGTDADTKEANALIAEVNSVLKDAYKVTAAVAVSKQLVGMLQEDLKDLKAAPATVKVAGIGLISMSVTRTTLNSVSQAQALLPRLQGLLDKTQDKLKAKPALAFKLGGLPGQLGGAVGGLAGVTKDAPELLGGISSLAGELTRL
jgi:hypothetical protein